MTQETKKHAFKAFHSHLDPDLGLDIRGMKSPEMLAAEGEAIFRFGVEGHSVLDIGAWDGWFTFEAERRGAAQVTASDWFCWGGGGWGTREVFDHVRAVRGSKAKDIEVDIPALNPAEHGQYDTVLLLGVLYHVRDMVSILDRAQALCHNQLIIETVTYDSEEPIARYWKLDSLGGDSTNFWTPSVACVKDMMAEWGFEKFEVTRTPNGPNAVYPDRHIIHCFRQDLPDRVAPVG